MKLDLLNYVSYPIKLYPRRFKEINIKLPMKYNTIYYLLLLLEFYNSSLYFSCILQLAMQFFCLACKV